MHMVRPAWGGCVMIASLCCRQRTVLGPARDRRFSAQTMPLAGHVVIIYWLAALRASCFVSLMKCFPVPAFLHCCMAVGFWGHSTAAMQHCESAAEPLTSTVYLAFQHSRLLAGSCAEAKGCSHIHGITRIYCLGRLRTTSLLEGCKQ